MEQNTKQVINHVIPKREVCLKCRTEPRRSGQRWGKACHAAYMRENRKKHSELSHDQRRRANARSYANVYKRRGVLVPEPCCICGTEDDVEMHHHDYDNPLDVEWLCRACHIRWHQENDV